MKKTLALLLAALLVFLSAAGYADIVSTEETIPGIMDMVFETEDDPEEIPGDTLTLEDEEVGDFDDCIYYDPEGLVYYGSIGALTWYLDDQGHLFVLGNGVMPSYDGDTSYAPWYAFKDSITTIEMGGGITTIGSYAFTGMQCVSVVVMPKTLQTIQEGAFANCTALGSVELPSGTTTVETKAFYGCSALQSAELGSITGIDSYTFGNCSALRRITIPSTVEYIADLAFYNCWALGNIKFNGDMPTLYSNSFAALRATVGYPAGNETWIESAMLHYGGTISYVPMFSMPVIRTVDSGEEDGILWVYREDGALIIGGEGEMPVYEFGMMPWALYIGEITSVIIKDGITSIGAYALSGAGSLKTVELSSTVEYIGEAAFADCTSLETISLPAACSAVEAYAFYGCTGLRSIKMAARMDSIADYAFCDCVSLKTVTMPVSLSSIGEYAFGGCEKIEALILPVDLTTMGMGAFAGCTALKSTKIPADVSVIDQYTYAGCTALESVALSEGQIAIGDHAFENTAIKALTLPSTIISIGQMTFAGCSSLESVELSADLKNIWIEAFVNCTSLRSVTIPSDVTRIYAGAFKGCTSLASITFKGSAPTIGENAFHGVTATVTLENDDATWTDSVRVSYGGQLTWPEKSGGNSGSIGGISWEVDESGTMTISGTGTFGDWGDGQAPWGNNIENLTAISLGEGITALGDGIFTGAVNLDSITLPESMTAIGANAFTGCTSLTTVGLPKNLTTLGANAFKGCTALEDMNIPSGMTTLSAGTFSGCTALESVTFGGMTYGANNGGIDAAANAAPACLTTIGANAFSGCKSLKSIIVPATVTSLNSKAFANCTALTSIRFLGSLPTFAKDVFTGVKGTIYVLDRDGSWTDNPYQDFWDDIIWCIEYEFELNPVQGIVAVTAGANANLVWSKIPDADGYAIYSCDIRNGSYDFIKTVTTLNGTVPAAAFYKVRAYKDLAEKRVYGEWSTSIAVTDLSGAAGLKAVRSDDGVNLAWNTIGSAAGYTLYRSTSKDGTYAVVKHVTAANVKIAEESGTYYYKIRPYVLSGSTRVYGAYSAAVEAVTLSAPTGLTVVLAGKTVNMAWNAVSGATNYTLYRSTSLNGTYTGQKSIKGTATNSAAPTSGTYYYKVRPFVLVGTTRLYGDWSDAAAIKDIGVPTGLAAVAYNKTVNMAWNPLSGAAGYSIGRSTASGSGFASIKSVSGTTTQTAGPASGTYYYKVRGYLLVGTQKVYGDYGTVAAIKDLTTTVTSCVSNAAGKVTLKWTAVPGVGGYSIYRATSSGGTYTSLKSVLTTSTTCASMKSGSTYYFKIRPYVMVGSQRVYGNFSEIQKITVR